MEMLGVEPLDLDFDEAEAACAALAAAAALVRLERKFELAAAAGFNIASFWACEMSKFVC